ncbi:MAG: class B sortase [Clostridia bacterium]|nr:class B sortase [Clostridia bacterium]MDY5556016.1 class B sortase [Blautia sp.]
MNKIKSFAVSMILGATGLMTYCGSFYVKSYEENRQARESYDNIRQLSRPDQEKDTDEPLDKVKKTAVKISTDNGTEDEIRESFGISWENLRKVNPQIVGWITVPGADISYPVVQGKDDEFYLSHSFSGDDDPFGCIFLGCTGKKDFSDSHSFIFGHNMEGNMMFANLNRYEKPEFLAQCPEFEITTPRRKFFYRIFSVQQASEGSAAFEYGYQVGSPQYRKQLGVLKADSMYETDVWPDDTCNMVTLITCNSRLDKNIRMAVHGICCEIIENTDTM